MTNFTLATASAGLVLSSGEVLDVISGGVAIAASVPGGAELAILSGGLDSASVIQNGGFELVESGGVADGTTLSNGGVLLVYAGGAVSSDVIASGGIANIFGGAMAGFTTLQSGGLDYVYGGALDYGALIAGTMDADGSVTGALIRGGYLDLDGGTGSHNTVGFGGIEIVFGGIESFATIEKGGIATVGGNGIVTSAVIAGGVLDVQADGLIGGDLSFTGTSGELILQGTIMPNAVISGFAHGDKIELEGATYSTGAKVSVGTPGIVTLVTGGAVYELNIAGAKPGETDFAFNGDLLLTKSACFAAGTRILTPRGEIAVENLNPGDLVITSAGEDAPIQWIGRRRLDLRRHPKPEWAQPVRILAGALEDGIPARDMLLSPDHCLFLSGVLIPVKALIDGAGIAQLNRAQVIYYHIELAAHGVIFAERAAVETYLETGSRAAFENGGTMLLLHPDFAQTRREAQSCAPLRESGPIVDSLRARIARRGSAYRSAGSIQPIWPSPRR